MSLALDTVTASLISFPGFLIALVLTEFWKNFGWTQTKKHSPKLLAAVAQYIDAIIPAFIEEGKDGTQLRTDIESFLEDYTGDDWGHKNPQELDELLKQLNYSLEILLNKNSYTKSVEINTAKSYSGCALPQAQSSLPSSQGG